MKAEKWMILGALAGLTAVAISKQLRSQRRRDAIPDEQPEATGRASVDDVPTLQEAAAGQVADLDERVAPATPF